GAVGLAVGRSEKLPALVHLQRLPRVMHRGRVEVSGDGRIARLRQVERTHPEVRAARQAPRRRSGAVVAAHARLRAVLAVVVMPVVIIVAVVIVTLLTA